MCAHKFLLCVVLDPWVFFKVNEYKVSLMNQIGEMFLHVQCIMDTMYCHEHLGSQ